MLPFPQIFPVQKDESGIATKHKILPKKVKQILNVKFFKADRIEIYTHYCE